MDLSHLTEDEVVAYLGHELTDESLRRVELHLAKCSECRAEIVETREILARPRRLRWPVLAPVAARDASRSSDRGSRRALSHRSYRYGYRGQGHGVVQGRQCR